MDTSPGPQASEQATEQASEQASEESQAPDPPKRSTYAGTFFKGCGCLSACVILGVGVAVVGKGELASWGSGLIGVLFLVLVVGTSGTNGWFNRNS